MRIAIFSDVHANLAALEAVIADWEPLVDQAWCLGDIVGYGPEPNACTDLVRKIAPIAVAGNHDWAAIGQLDLSQFNDLAAAAAEWTSQLLTPESAEYLAGLPLRYYASEIGLAHGSPRDPIWEYVLSSSAAAANLAEYPGVVWFVGHSHIALAYSVKTGRTDLSALATIRSDAITYDRWLPLAGRRHLVNPGSVGQPRDGDPAARYAILDLDQGAYLRRRVSYDVARTQARMRQVGLPELLALRLSMGR